MVKPYTKRYRVLPYHTVLIRPSKYKWAKNLSSMHKMCREMEEAYVQQLTDLDWRDDITKDSYTPFENIFLLGVTFRR